MLFSFKMTFKTHFWKALEGEQNITIDQVLDIASKEFIEEIKGKKFILLHQDNDSVVSHKIGWNECIESIIKILRSK